MACSASWIDTRGTSIASAAVLVQRYSSGGMFSVTRAGLTGRLSRTGVGAALVRLGWPGAGALDIIVWQTGAARLLKDRKTGPVFVTERQARVQLPAADLDEHGRARLSYQQAEGLFAKAEQRNGEWRYLEFLQVTSLITAEMFLCEIPDGTRARQRSRPVDLPEHRY